VIAPFRAQRILDAAGREAMAGCADFHTEAVRMTAARALL
jgi:hypothetical protein